MTIRTRTIALSIVIFSGLVYLFAWSPVFTVKSISTSGIPKEISADFIIAKTEIAIGERMARIEPRASAKALAELSWVKSTNISRNWLRGEISIELKTRIPVGIYRGRVLDSSGFLFDMPGNIPNGLPLVSAASPELGLAAIDLFTNLPIEIRDSLLSISANNSSAISSWQSYEGRKIKVNWGSVDQVNLKVSVYRALLALAENKNVRRIDLSAPHAPIVK